MRIGVQIAYRRERVEGLEVGLGIHSLLVGEVVEGDVEAGVTAEGWSGGEGSAPAGGRRSGRTSEAERERRQAAGGSLGYQAVARTRRRCCAAYARGSRGTSCR